MQGTGKDATEPRDGNVVLIGMPACGKSTVGVLLAKRLSLDFIDTDVLIQARERHSLPGLIRRHGTMEFRRLEQRHVVELACRHTVIATGGSVVYGEAAMQHLASIGFVVYLVTAVDELKARVGDPVERGIVMRSDQTLEALHAERDPLYRRWANAVVDGTGQRHESVVDAITATLPPGLKT